MALGRGVGLGDFLERLALVHRSRRLVEEASGPTYTYEQAAARVALMAGAIAAMVRPGDRVALALPNSYDVVLASLAAVRAGAVAVPLNAELTDTERETVVNDAGAAVVVRHPEELLGAAPLEAPAPAGSVAAIFYTSGTTGRPKGARLGSRALLGQISAAALWPSGLRRDEAVFGLPLSHIMGFVAVLGVAGAGVPSYFLPHFRPDAALDAIEARRATFFIGVPAMYRMMVEAGAEERDLSSVRVWASGADVMPPELVRRFQDMGAILTLPGGRSLGRAAFIEGYGMVETGGGVAVKVATPLPFRLPLIGGDSLGVPIPPNRMRVVGEDGHDVGAGDVGELWVKGPGVLEGYHGDEAATRAVLTDDGWLRTGDMVRRGPMGTVSFVGREKDVIKRGGYSVYAVEVEGVLETHPAVAEAAVVGLPDDRLGEVPVAAVRLAPGQSATEEELALWATDHLAGFKVPVRFLVVDQLPRTGTRKVRRAELRRLFV
ncbi:MAG TPA: AMP-binding protein [Acidimicrobiales bacterium]|nr:AMP-binding protein [Acidimicrobiales bacterium]